MYANFTAEVKQRSPLRPKSVKADNVLKPAAVARLDFLDF
jgi:hypothetical protein